MEGPSSPVFQPPTDRTYTLTFGDQAENHHGMQKIGTLSSEGFTPGELVEAGGRATKLGYQVQLYDLKRGLPVELRTSPGAEEAYFLVIQGGVNLFRVGSEDLGAILFQEQDNLPYDAKALMRGRVVNKHARTNLCFGPVAQEPKYEEGKGRIVPFSSVPALDRVRTGLESILGPKARDLVVESNYYYDITRCGIGFHGDTERRKVVGVRLGASLPLVFQWYYQSEPQGSLFPFLLNHGDLYVMSTKTTGYDWKRRSIFTLRHAAGCSKFIQPKKV